jgi:polyribonucleotide nucleotidyltransferase
VHISKLGRGRRINRVEDVLDLGDEVSVRVDDIDPNGKVSLTPIGPGFEGEGGEAPPASAGAGAAAAASGREADDAPAVVSFEDAFDSEAREVFGDLGPNEAASVSPARESSGGERRGGDRGRGGPRRRR